MVTVDDAVLKAPVSVVCRRPAALGVALAGIALDVMPAALLGALLTWGAHSSAAIVLLIIYGLVKGKSAG